MALILPGFYEQFCWNVETDVLRPLFQPQLSNTNVVSWIPKPDVYNDVLAAGGGYLRTYRVGGAYNLQDQRDEPIVEIAALRPSRDESWELIDYVRAVLWNFWQETKIIPGTSIRMSMVGEVAGPHLIPELLQDDKLVPITVRLHVKPKKLPDYRAALNLNDL